MSEAISTSVPTGPAFAAAIQANAPAAVDVIEIRGVVKWFNPKKAYGFIVPAATYAQVTEGEDVFVHLDTVKAFGLETLKEGDEVRLMVVSVEKGYEAEEVLQVTPAPLDAPKKPSTRQAGEPRQARSSKHKKAKAQQSPAKEPAKQEAAELGELVDGVLKFFNDDRGFGFVTPQGGGKDVFVHVSVMEKCNMPAIPEGAPVRYQVGPGKRGPEVKHIEPASA